MKKCVAALATIAALAAIQVADAAPAKVPVAALKALKVTRGKPISSGMVFMDGKYIPPPYTVERYGTAIRINNIQVTGPLIPWDEFLKTQPDAKVTRTTTEIPGEAAPEEAPVEEESYDDFDDDPLADLFGDAPKPKKPKAAVARRKPAGPRKVTTVKVEFDGTFEMNAAAKKMVDKINARRTAVDKRLREGGFYFFGTSYSGTSGDSSTTAAIIKTLPDAMRSAASPEQLAGACRANGLSFLSMPIFVDLFANRNDYIKLQERRKKMEEDAKWRNMLRGGN